MNGFITPEKNPEQYKILFEHFLEINQREVYEKIFLKARIPDRFQTYKELVESGFIKSPEITREINRIINDLREYPMFKKEEMDNILIYLLAP